MTAVVLAVAVAYAVFYVGFRATLLPDLKAWLVDRDILARDFFTAGALCPVCSVWWVLVASHAVWVDFDPVKLAATYGVFLGARDLSDLVDGPYQPWVADLLRAGAAVAVVGAMLGEFDWVRALFVMGVYQAVRWAATHFLEDF